MTRPTREGERGAEDSREELPEKTAEKLSTVRSPKLLGAEHSLENASTIRASESLPSHATTPRTSRAKRRIKIVSAQIAVVIAGLVLVEGLARGYLRWRGKPYDSAALVKEVRRIRYASK